MRKKELTQLAPPRAGRGPEERTSRQTSGLCASVLCGLEELCNNTKYADYAFKNMVIQLETLTPELLDNGLDMV